MLKFFYSVDLKGLWQRPQTWDWLYSSANTTSHVVIFLIKFISFFTPGQRRYFLIGDDGENSVDPIINNWCSRIPNDPINELIHSSLGANVFVESKPCILIGGVHIDFIFEEQEIVLDVLQMFHHCNYYHDRKLRRTPYHHTTFSPFDHGCFVSLDCRIVLKWFLREFPHLLKPFWLRQLYNL